MLEARTCRFWRRHPTARRARLLIWLRGLVLAASLPWLFAGCLRSPFVNQAAVPSYKPANVYREEAFLPPSIKRVAVLPLPTLTDEAPVDCGPQPRWRVPCAAWGRARLR